MATTIKAPIRCGDCGVRRLECGCACDHAVVGKRLCNLCCAHRLCQSCHKCTIRSSVTLARRDEAGMCVEDRCQGCHRRSKTFCNCCQTPVHAYDAAHPDWSQEIYTVRRRDGYYPSRLCPQCCQHDCCRVQVEHVQRPLVFWTPTAKVAKEAVPFEPLPCTTAEGVLGKLVGAGALNLNLFLDNRSRRYASVELEVCATQQGRDVNLLCSKWSCSVVRDGSINAGAPGGYEINTAPACGDALVAQLTQVVEAVRNGKSTINDSCGLHVHVDARDFGYEDIARLMRVWNVIEPALFASVEPARAASRYCLPCGKVYGQVAETDEVKRDVVEAVYGKGSYDGMSARRTPHAPVFHKYRRQHRGAGDGTGRYYSLSYHSWFLRGTVENRMHHGTLDFLEIYNWTKMNVDLLDAVYVTGDSKLKELTLKIGPTDRALIQDAIEFSPKIDVLNGLVVLSRLLAAEQMDHLLAQVNRFGA